MSFWNDFEKDELTLMYLKALAVMLGLKRNQWDFPRGAKSERIYTKDGVDRVKVFYSYEYQEYDNQNSTNSLVPVGNKFEDRRSFISLEETVYYLNSDGSIFHEFDVPVTNDDTSVSRINREIRLRRINFLERAGIDLRNAYESLPPAVDQPTLDFLISQSLVPPNLTLTTYPFFRQGLLDSADGVDTIFNHYAGEISHYTLREGSNHSFEDSIRNETDNNILTILNLGTPPTPEFPQGLTIREAISYQLLGVLNGL